MMVDGWLMWGLLSAFVGAVVVGSAAGAGLNGRTATLSTLARKGRRLGADEIQALVRTGARVVRWHPDGCFQSWTNLPHGQLIANSNDSMTWGRGRWQLKGETLCVEIDWIHRESGLTAHEAGCYAFYVWRGKYYYGPSEEPAAARNSRFGEIQFSR